MKANELMIGDWVCIPPITGNRIEYFTKVTGIGKDVILFDRESGYDNISLERVNPIPLTTEILEKNGFRRCRYISMYKKEEFEFGVEIGNSGLCIEDQWDDSILLFSFKFVHELQHALRLYGLNDLADNFIV